MYEPELLDLPLLPLRDVVVYPHMVIPLFVGRDKSIQALETAMNGQKKIFVVAQKDAADDDPNQTGLYTVGTVATILQLLKLPDGTVKVLVEGQRRALVDEIVDTGRFLLATVKEYRNEALEPLEVEGLSRSLLAEFEQYVKQAKKVTPEVLTSVQAIKEPYRLSDTIAAHLSLKLEEKQEILEIPSILDRAQKVLGYLNEEVQLLELKNSIHNKVKVDIEKQQRDYFLNQQIKTIQEELGGDSFLQEIQKMRDKAKEKKWSEKVAEVFEKEIGKLQRINPAAAEYSMLLNYLELMIDMPWNEYSADNFDLKRAEKILEEDHFGLEKVKDRILEYLAVLKLKGDLKSPILCFVGPPGVGKTSLGKSIAKALERK